MKHHALIGIVFVIGCATGGVAAQLVVPPVRAGTSPTRWEYKCVFVKAETVDLDATLNKLGAEGWELATMERHSNGTFIAHDYTLCTKRALP
jgi:hypothetical protein